MIMLMRLLALGALVTACTTLSDSPKKAPAITTTMPLEEVISIALEHGGRSLEDARARIKAQKEYPKAEPLLFNFITNRSRDWPTNSLANALTLYRLRPPKKVVAVFEDLVREKNQTYRQMAWQLAGAFPSSAMAISIDKYLTDLVADDELEQAFVPDMASALANNRLKSSYSVVREAFYLKGDVDYARAMAQLQPESASADFLAYLQRPSIEELRQLNLETVNIYTCTLILQHYTHYPPAISSGLAETLFKYSVSRNHGLADMSREVIEKYVVKHGRYLALVLARMPTMIQIAFVEKSNRQMTPMITRLLDELMDASPSKDIVEEIQNIRR